MIRIAQLIPVLALAACAAVERGGAASALVGTGKLGATPMSGASGSTAGTIDNPGASPATHMQERSPQNVAMALAALGYERLSGISVDEEGIAADAERAGRPARIGGRWLGGGQYFPMEEGAFRQRLVGEGYGAVGAISRDGGRISATAVRDGKAVTLHLDGPRRLLVEASPKT